MNKKGLTVLGFLAGGLLLIIPLFVAFIGQQQNSRTTADVACPVPGQVTNVRVDYPNCEGATCSYTQANCTWNAVTGAQNYSVKVTEVDTGNIVKSNTEPAATLKTVFPVTNGKTYKCEIAAVNSCGTSGAVGSHSLLCQVEDILPTSTPTPTVTPPLIPTATLTPTPTTQPGVPTATPTVGPTATPRPTSPPLPTATPRPTIEDSGSIETTIGIGAVGLILTILGGMIFLF